MKRMKLNRGGKLKKSSLTSKRMTRPKRMVASWFYSSKFSCRSAALIADAQKRSALCLALVLQYVGAFLCLPAVHCASSALY